MSDLGQSGARPCDHCCCDPAACVDAQTCADPNCTRRRAAIDDQRFERLWRDEMHSYGFSEEAITEMWDAAREAGRNAQYVATGKFNIWSIPQQPERQDSLTEQVRDVVVLAKRIGCFDAAEWIARRLEKR